MNHIRQGQNNNSKRSRGRGRKPQNSTNRAYDSNGPDVKIRGTAMHVCEKYQQLARDAISSGDRVMAENYYQHAEHYYRLLMASQTLNEGQMRPQNSLGYRPDEDQEEEEEDTGFEVQPQVGHQPYHQQTGGGHYTPNNGQPNQNNQGNYSGGQNGGQGNPQNNNQNFRRPMNPINEGGEPREDEDRGGEEGGGFAPSANAIPPSGDGQRRRQNRRRRQRHDPNNPSSQSETDGEQSGADDSRGSAESSNDEPVA